MTEISTSYQKDVIKDYSYDIDNNWKEMTVGNKVTAYKYDKETEKIYLRVRYYQPIVGKFLTKDTYTEKEEELLNLGGIRKMDLEKLRSDIKDNPLSRRAARRFASFSEKQKKQIEMLNDMTWREYPLIYPSWT